MVYVAFGGVGSESLSAEQAASSTRPEMVSNVKYNLLIIHIFAM
jgi:hypothetical protein